MRRVPYRKRGESRAGAREQAELFAQAGGKLLALRRHPHRGIERRDDPPRLDPDRAGDRRLDLEAIGVGDDLKAERLAVLELGLEQLAEPSRAGRDACGIAISIGRRSGSGTSTAAITVDGPAAAGNARPRMACVITARAASTSGDGS
jgi:hypothetical protein